MNREDNEAQQRAEQGNFNNIGNDGDDAVAYERVFRALSRKPVSDILPPDFADKVVAAAFKTRRKDVLLDYAWMAIGLLVLAIAFVVTIKWSGLETGWLRLHIDWGFLNFLSSYRPALIFGLVFIAIFQLIDRRFIRPNMNNKATLL